MWEKISKMLKFSDLVTVIAIGALVVGEIWFVGIVEDALNGCLGSFSQDWLRRVGMPLAFAFMAIVLWSRRRGGSSSKDSIVLFMQSVVTAHWAPIISLVAFGCHFSWGTDMLKDAYLGQDGMWLKGATFLIGSVLVVLLQPKAARKPEVPDEERTLLVSGLSYPRGEFNLNGFAYPLEHYRNTKKVLVFTSKENMESESKCGKNIYEDVREAMERALGSGGTLPKVEYVLVDMNNFEECYNAVEKRLGECEGGDTRGTVINVSPGTSALTSALTLHAIRGQRLMTYNKQGGEHKGNVNVKVRLDVFTVETLVRELRRELDES